MAGAGLPTWRSHVWWAVSVSVPRADHGASADQGPSCRIVVDHPRFHPLSTSGIHLGSGKPGMWVHLFTPIHSTIHPTIRFFQERNPYNQRSFQSSQELLIRKKSSTSFISNTVAEESPSIQLNCKPNLADLPYLSSANPLSPLSGYYDALINSLNPNIGFPLFLT